MTNLTEAIAAAHAALDERFYPGPTEEMVRCAVEAAAPLIAAKALREAADALEMYSDRDNPVPDDPRWTCDLGYYGEAAWLRVRASLLEACCPHPKCPGGSLCCCADAIEAGQS